MLDRSSQSPTQIPTDALSEVLQDFRLSGVNYGRCELRHPWSIAFPQQQLLRFHFVSEGPCWIHTEAQGWQELQDGDLVLLPQGVEHRLASKPDVVGDSLKSCQVTKLGGNVCEVVQEGTGATSTLFCGSMALGANALNPLIALMPPIIKGCDVAGNDPIVGPLLAAMTAEASQPQIGSATVLSRMADVLVARLIRCWVNCSGASTSGWLAAIRDPHIGRELNRKAKGTFLGCAAAGRLNKRDPPLPRDGFFVEEDSQMGFTARLAFPVYGPRQYVTCGYQDNLGFGFNTALGVKVGNPDKAVVSVSGDGGFMFGVQELATAVQHNIAVVAIVFNNNAYGNVLRDQKQTYSGRYIGSDLTNPDFVKLGESFGVKSFRATSPNELKLMIAEALKLNAPVLIEVPIEKGSEASPWPFIHPAPPAA